MTQTSTSEPIDPTAAAVAASLDTILAAAYERLEPLTGPGRTALQHTIDELRDLRTVLRSA